VAPGGHIHYVVQPVTRDLVNRYESYGPNLQAAMFAKNETPAVPEVTAFAELARAAFRA